MSGKHGLRQGVSFVHLVDGVELRAVTVLACKTGIHEVGVIQHELLNGCASARARIPGLVEVLKKRKPR